MTLEDFAHRCLMIKAGNATLDIPCCANCKYYIQEKYSDSINGLAAYLKGTIIEHLYNGGTAKVVETIEDENGVEFFCATTGEFISKDEAEQIRCENVSESVSYKYICDHPVLESDDSYVGAWLETKPEDFCSRWESRNEEKEVEEKNKKTRKRKSNDH